MASESHMELHAIPVEMPYGIDMQVFVVGKSDKRTVGLIVQSPFDAGDVICNTLSCCDLAWILCSLPHTQDTVPPGCPNCCLRFDGQRVVVVAAFYLPENTELYFEEQCRYLSQSVGSVCNGSVSVGMSVDPLRPCAVYATRVIQKGELICERCIEVGESITDSNCAIGIMMSAPGHGHITGGNTAIHKSAYDGRILIRVVAIGVILPGDTIIPIRSTGDMNYKYQKAFPSVVLVHGEAECGAMGRFVRPFDVYCPENGSVQLADVPKKCRQWHVVHDTAMSTLKNCCLRHSLKTIDGCPRFKTTTSFQRFVADLLFGLLPDDMGLQPADFCD